jgi:hypothetical protein
MATVDTTAVAYQLKRVYGDRITDLFKRHTMTYNMFQKSSRKATIKPGGAGYYFSSRQGDIESIGGRVQGGILPEPLAGDGVQGTITPKLIYGVLRLSGLAIEAGKGDVMSFVDVQGDAISNVYKALINDLNRMCWGDSYGHLATLSAASDALATGATWTVTMANDTGTRYLKKGMIVDFYDGASIDQSSVASRISSIDPNAQTMEMEAVAATGAGGSTYQAAHPLVAARTYTIATDAVPNAAEVVRYGARLATHATTNAAYEMMGLRGIYDDGTLITTFEGINTTNDPEWKANIISNSGVAIDVSIDRMLAAVDMTAARSNSEASMIRMGLGQRRKYFSLLAGDVRYAPGKFLGGYETLDFAQNARVKIVVDPHTRPGAMYFEPEGCIKRYELTPIGWGGLDGQKMHWRQDYDEATMFLRLYSELGTEARNELTLLSDLKEPDKMPF